MDLKLIRNLVRIMERGEVDEIEIEDEKAGLRVHLRRGAAPGMGGPQVVMVPGGAYAAHSAPALPANHHGASYDGDVGSASRPAGVEEITSPMIGTFYSASAPDADPFVSIGARIDDDSVVCIIEAMKVMNEIKSDCTGEIVEVLVESGEPVEFGQPLFLVKRR